MAKQKAVRDKYIINLNGQKIEVSQEVYYAWYGGERQERYQEEKDTDNDVKPFSALGPEDTDILEVLAGEDDVQSETESCMIREEIASALGQLPSEDQELILALYWREIPRSRIAREKGVTEGAIRKRERRILGTLKKFLQKN